MKNELIITAASGLFNIVSDCITSGNKKDIAIKKATNERDEKIVLYTVAGLTLCYGIKELCSVAHHVIDKLGAKDNAELNLNILDKVSLSMKIHKTNDETTMKTIEND